MESNFWGAFFSFLAGVAIAFAGYMVSRHVLKKDASKYVAVQTVKQILQVAFLVLLFFLADFTPWSKVWILAGGVFGITLPMFYFTHRLVKLNDSLQGKEDSSNG